jgi:hypothetical protein
MDIIYKIVGIMFVIIFLGSLVIVYYIDLNDSWCKEKGYDTSGLKVLKVSEYTDPRDGYVVCCNLDNNSDNLKHYNCTGVYKGGK